MIKTSINIIIIIISVIIALLISELIVRTFIGDKIVLFPCYTETATYGEYQIQSFLQPNTSKSTQAIMLFTDQMAMDTGQKLHMKLLVLH